MTRAEKYAELRAQGLTNGQIAERFDVNPQDVAQAIYRLKPEARAKGVAYQRAYKLRKARQQVEP